MDCRVPSPVSTVKPSYDKSPALPRIPRKRRFRSPKDPRYKLPFVNNTNPDLAVPPPAETDDVLSRSEIDELINRAAARE